MEKQLKLAEKERKLKEEQEKEAERLRKKPNIAQFFSKKDVINFIRVPTLSNQLTF